MGFSTLLHSRLSSIFHDKITVKCFSMSEFTQNSIVGLDIVVSTVNLPLATNEYLLVHPMLTEADIANISDKIANLALNDGLPVERHDINLLHRVEEIKLISSEISSLLRLFRLYHVSADVSFNELLIETSRLMGNDEFQQAKILEALTEREALSTQVIPEYGIVFLHSKNEHVQESVFALIRAKDGVFSTTKLDGIKVAVVMLVPKNDLRQSFAITSISEEIFGNEIFLRLIKYGEEHEIKLHVEKILNRYLINSVTNLEYERSYAC
jgi:mannitol operon transcriptional antiterminator